MNTGSGKTVVGLMILQSSLNEELGPAIYVVPDKYLIKQVINEAESLGIKATSDRDDYSYSENKSILVTSIHSLVYGKSVFGMRNSNNYPIGTIIIDDVHACLDTIEKQFSVVTDNDSEAYREVQKTLDKLSFEADSNSFESALETVGRLLGFVSSRPDRETKGEGPDNLWALGNGKYWVIECKNEARTEEISKDYCNQLGGSIRWFHATYPHEYSSTPILVHISSKASEKATPVDEMRIINEQSLNRLRDQILRYCIRGA